MLRVGESGAAAGGSALGDGRASPDAPFQQVLRAERSAGEAASGGEVEERPPLMLMRSLTA